MGISPHGRGGIGRNSIPDLVLGPLFKSPGASSHHLMARNVNRRDRSNCPTESAGSPQTGQDIQFARYPVRCRSMSPPRRYKSDETCERSSNLDMNQETNAVNPANPNTTN